MGFCNRVPEAMLILTVHVVCYLMTSVARLLSIDLSRKPRPFTISNFSPIVVMNTRVASTVLHLSTN